MTDTETETIELTNALLQCLLNMTGREVESDRGPRGSLARTLHGVKFMLGNRWKVEVTEENIKTIHVLMIDYTKEHRTPAVRTRFHNYLCHQSPTYDRLFRHWDVTK